MATEATSAVALKTQNGDSTPLSISPFALNDAQVAKIQKEIATASKADKSAFTDITPVYWEAKRGETITAAFLGWKESTKVDEKTGEVTETKYFAVFHDGNRQIVAGQIALLEAMYGKQMNAIYRITCDEATAGKAKKFTVEQFNG